MKLVKQSFFLFYKRIFNVFSIHTAMDSINSDDDDGVAELNAEEGVLANPRRSEGHGYDD